MQNFTKHKGIDWSEMRAGQHVPTGTKFPSKVQKTYVDQGKIYIFTFDGVYRSTKHGARKIKDDSSISRLRFS